MAGIGFELKNCLTDRDFLLPSELTDMRESYVPVRCFLELYCFLALLYLCDKTGGSRHSRELLVCMITYTLLFSLTVTSFLSMVVTRFIADMLYEEKYDMVLPSFWGSTGIMLVAGGILYGIFLIFSGAGLLDGLLCLWLFGELTVNLECNELSHCNKRLQRNHAVIYSCYCDHIYIRLGIADAGNSPCGSSSDCSGCGIRSDAFVGCDPFVSVFSTRGKGCLPFPKMVDQFLPLAFTGLFINIGLFAHLVIMWVGPLQVQVQGLFVGAPYHDVPALVAFLTILVTTVNFVVSVEVNFYPKYKTTTVYLMIKVL